MRAIAVTEPGGPDALHAVDLPEPHAGPGQVRVRVSYATVNPTDTNVREGRYSKRQEGKKPPFVPGMDLSGTVDEVGDEVSRLSVDERVMALVLPAGSHGGYSELLVLPEASVVPVPAGADLAAASTLLMNGMTARLSLDALALDPGQTLAVTGAAGSYGGYVVQLAKADGLTVIADATEEDAELVRSLGADHVLTRGAGFAQAVRDLVPDGVDGLADGSVQQDEVTGAIRDNGGMAVIRGWDGEAGRGITVHKIWVFTAAEETAGLLDLRAKVESGQLTLRVADVLPAEQAPEAHRRLAAGGVRGRLVLDLT